MVVLIWYSDVNLHNLQFVTPLLPCQTILEVKLRSFNIIVVFK